MSVTASACQSRKSFAIAALFLSLPGTAIAQADAPRVLGAPAALPLVQPATADIGSVSGRPSIASTERTDRGGLGEPPHTSDIASFDPPASDAAVGTTRLVLPRAAGFGRGLSGAINILLTDAGGTLDPWQVAHFGTGWESGHRWVAHEVNPGPRLLGAVASDPAEGSGLTDVRRFHPEPRDPTLPPEPLAAPPTPGFWHLESGTGYRVDVVTRVPATQMRGGVLNGYRIGHYPLGGGDAYAPPTAFIEVTPENKDFHVSEHLTLAQFLTKDQFDVWPKYLALDLRLVDKLELVIQELNSMGIRADRVHVMSGYRTPNYNGPGGDGRAALSRHMWGDAADIWIDSVGDGHMDDLNGDGVVDMGDAAVIMRAVERVERRYPELVGGAGVYPDAPHHGPYIHIDARGRFSRW